MEGLPQSPGVLGLALLLIGLVVGSAWAWRLRGSVATAVDGFRPVVVLLLVLVATTVGVTPFVVWRIVEDVRYTSGIDAWLAPRYGVSVFKVHPEMFDNAARLIPPGDTYYAVAAPDLPRNARFAFRVWGLQYLLPRRAVTDPVRAQWIMTLGVDPATVGPPVSQTWRLKEPVNGMPAAYLAKVRT